MAKATSLRDARGSHTRLYHDIQDSHAWHALTYTEQAMYMAMRRQLMSFNNGDIKASVKELSGHGFTSTSTVAKSLRSMLTLGLIDKTRQGRMTFGGKSCSLYRFTDVECFDIPKSGTKAMKATNEWKGWKTRAEAQSAVLAAHAAAVNPDHRNAKKNKATKASPDADESTSKVRKSNRISSPIESERRLSDSPAEICERAPIRLANEGASTEIARKPPSLLDIALSRRTQLAA